MHLAGWPRKLEQLRSSALACALCYDAAAKGREDLRLANALAIVIPSPGLTAILALGPRVPAIHTHVVKRAFIGVSFSTKKKRHRNKTTLSTQRSKKDFIETKSFGKQVTLDIHAAPFAQRTPASAPTTIA